MKLEKLIVDANPVTTDSADVIPEGYGILVKYDDIGMDFIYNFIYKNSKDGIYAIQTPRLSVEDEHTYFDRDDFPDSETGYKKFYFDVDMDDFPITPMSKYEFSRTIEKIAEDEAVHFEIWNHSAVYNPSNKGYGTVFEEMASDLIENRYQRFESDFTTKLRFIDGTLKKATLYCSSLGGAFEESLATKIDEEIDEMAPNETPNRPILEDYNPNHLSFFCNTSSVRPSGVAVEVGDEVFAFANYYLALNDGCHEDTNLGDVRFYIASKGNKYKIERAYKDAFQEIKRWHENAVLLAKTEQLLAVFVEAANAELILEEDHEYIGTIAKDTLDTITEEKALELIKQKDKLKMADIIKDASLLSIIEEMLDNSQKIEFEGGNPETIIPASYCSSSYPNLKPDLEEIEDED